MIFVWAHSLEVARVDFAIPRGLGMPGREWTLVRGLREVYGGVYESGRDELVVVHTNGNRLTDEQREALEWCQSRGYAHGTVTHIGPNQPISSRRTSWSRRRPELGPEQVEHTMVDRSGAEPVSVRSVAHGDVDPAFIQAELGRRLDAALHRAFLYGDPDPFPETEQVAIHVDQQVEPVRVVNVPLRRGDDGHLYRTDAAVAAAITARERTPAPERFTEPATPPTQTEEELMPADEDTQPLPMIWTEVRIILPPGADVRAVLDSLVAASDGQVEYEMVGDGGSLASIGPCPAPRMVLADHPSG